MTRKRLALCLIGALVLCGCGSKAPPVARPKTNLSGPATRLRGPLQPKDGENGVDAAEVRKGLYQGKTPAEWSEALKSNNAAKREQATQALRSLGEAGYPPLRDGLNNAVTEVRLRSLQAIDLPVLRKHQDEMVPVLLSLLADPSPVLREQAAVRLAWFDSTGANQSVKTGAQAQQRLQALDYAAQNDPAPNVRLAAATSMQCIRSAMSGRVNSD
jgi:hypothetical protein